MPTEDERARTGRRRVSGFAVAALILGFLGVLPWTFFAAVPAVICGHLALARIHRSGNAARGRIPAVAGLALGYVMTAFWALELPALLTAGQVRENARRVACANNMKGIGLACHLYAADHGGAFPDAWPPLYPDCLSALPCWVCPSTRTTPGDEDSIDAWADYVLIPGHTENDTPDDVLAYCRPGNHGKDGTMVLFVDGDVEWVSAERFGELMSDAPNAPGPGGQ